MHMLRVEIEGITTSFRYPHFLIGRQPSYPMPPPATILGLVAGALGYWPEPEQLRFTYTFSCAGRVDDVENIYATEVGGSIPREDRGRFPYPVNITGTMNPVLREVLLHPRLTLYLDAPGWLEELHAAFRSPVYMALLGRSQDLVAFRKVEMVEMESAPAGYLEGTLVRWSQRERFRVGFGLVLPRYIDPDNRRRVFWSPYLVLERTAFLAPQDPAGANRGSAWVVAEPGEQFDVDPDSPARAGGLRRILHWHSFVSEEVTFELAASNR
jgi:CRISPR-associated protein Cas5t